MSTTGSEALALLENADSPQSATPTQVLQSSSSAPLLSEQVPPQEDKRKRITLPGGYAMRTPLYGLQIVGAVRLGKPNNTLGLFDKMGLGKTLTALAATANLLWTGELQDVIIVCEASHVHIWEDHINEHVPEFGVQVLNGKPDERIWNPSFRYHVISYQLLSYTKIHSVPQAGENGRGCVLSKAEGVDAERMEKYLQERFCGLILDEGHYIRTPTSQTTQCLHYMSDLAYWRTLLTGTLVAENLENVWAPAYFLDQGKLLGKTYREFEREYTIKRRFEMNGRTFYKIVGYKNTKKLHRKIKQLGLRRTKGVDLPPKMISESPIILPSTDPYYKWLSEIRYQLIASLEAMTGEEINLKDASKTSGLIQDLHRAAAIRAGVVGPKMDLLYSRLRETKDQVIVWCAHKQVVEDCVDLLREDNSVVGVHGGITPKKRIPLINAFKEGKYRILVATQDLMRSGHTLANCHYEFYLQLSWSLLNWIQSQDRAHRIGQESPVLIEVPILNCSLDRYMYDTLKRKEGLANAVQDGKKVEIFSRSSLIQFLKSW